MEKNLEKFTKEELINKISKMSKKNIIKMLTNKSGGGEISNISISSPEIIIEPIVFDPTIVQNKNKNNNKKYNEK